MLKSKCILSLFYLSFLCNLLSTQAPVDSLIFTEAKELYQHADQIYDQYPDSAIQIIYQAGELYQKSGAHDYYVGCLNALSVSYYYLGPFNKYHFYVKKAMKEAEQLLPDTHFQYAQALHNLSTFYNQLGDYEQTIRMLKQALAIKKRTGAPNLNLAFSYNNIGTALTEKGDYLEAIEYLSRGLALRQEALQKKPNPNIARLTIATKNNIARAHQLNQQATISLNQYLTNLKDIYQFMLMKGANQKLYKRELIITLQRIAKIYLVQKKYNKAKKQIREALSFQSNDFLFRKPRSYELLGDIALAQSDYPKAITHYQAAIQLSQTERFNKILPDYARKVSSLAKVYSQTGDDKKAIQEYHKALQILAPGFKSNEIADNPKPSELYAKLDALTILNNKGQAIWQQYRTTQNPNLCVAANQTFYAGIELIKNIRRSIVTKRDKNTLSERTVAIFEGAIQTTLERHKLTQDPRFLNEAFFLAERNKSLLLLESINEQVALGTTSLPDSLLQKDKQLRLEIAYYQKQIIDAGQKEKADPIKSWNNQLFELNQELQTLRDHLEKAYPNFARLKYPDTQPSLKSIQTLLDQQGEVMIEYFFGEQQIYLFVISANDCQVITLEHPEKLSDKIEQFREAVRTLPSDQEVKQNYQTIAQLGYELYQLLLEPAIQSLDQQVAAIRLIPDGLLSYIPFEVLLTQAAPTTLGFSAQHLAYLATTYPISYDYSATWMLRNQAEEKAPTTAMDLLAYAPSFPKATDSVLVNRACIDNNLYYLSCTEQEVSAIGDILNGTVRTGSMATTTDFLQDAPGARILHLATHACANEDNPLFNKIFLHNDYLSNAQLANLDLPAELAVLSACNTGSGKLVRGEGVLSLARGFAQAGCRSTVVSRWSVDDCTTAEIMQYFYQELTVGQPKQRALQGATLRYLENADAFYQHPYYWAAFMAYGDMERMSFRANLRLWHLGLTLFGVLGIGFLYRRFQSSAA